MTDAPDKSLAPGCFGLAMTYRSDARECAVCPFASECAPLAAHNLAVLRTELGITVPEPTPAKATATAGAADMAAPAVPRVVIAEVERADRLGIKIGPAIARGENPYKGRKPFFLQVAFHALLKRAAEGLPRPTLVACFMQSLGLDDAAADRHATHTIQFLEAVGAGDERNGLIRLRV